MTNSLTETDRDSLYSRVVEQIKREDNLIDHRVTYTLTFQSILFAALAFTARSDEANPIAIVLREVAPVFGFGVAILSLLGVIAGFISIWEKLGAWRLHLKGDPEYASPTGNGFVLFMAWSMYMCLMGGIALGWAYVWWRLNV